MGLFKNPVGFPILGLDRNYSIDQIPSLAGKVAIVTGGSRGIGYQTSLALARAGAKVYIAAQSQGKALESITEIKKLVGGNAELEFLQLKLQSIAAAAAAAREFLDRESRLDIIVANAGIHSKNVLNEDGIEAVMGVNHVGHHVFITALLPLMLATTKIHNVDTRIAVTSSHSHFDIKTPKEFDFAFFTSTKTPTSDKLMDFNIRYARSKLANNLFAKHLAELLMTPEYKAQGGDRVFVNVAHPGFIKTDIAGSIGDASSKWFGALVGWLGETFGITPAEGALTQLFLVTGPRVEREGIRGRYFVPVAKEIAQNKLVTSDLAARLWEWTEEQKVKALARET
jgi:NAD(P)-dependent dehydrogenase (short-subunit alcohol dehydrogenase family)